MGFEWIPRKKYKRHYICLSCQKGFKRPAKEDMFHKIDHDFSSLMEKYYALETKKDVVQYIQDAYDQVKVTCPNCSSNMTFVHYDFEVPAQKNNKAWKKLQQTLLTGYEFSFETYISWHQLQLNKTAKKSADFKQLEQNLVQLKKAKEETI